MTQSFRAQPPSDFVAQVGQLWNENRMSDPASAGMNIPRFLDAFLGLPYIQKNVAQTDKSRQLMEKMLTDIANYQDAGWALASDNRF